ncbi:MAG: hypothetical protein KDL87_08045 [Verrucomicrobiae bacterium]|nr:hypothetical protein [Verrucomicrobiae bacterium]
MLVSKDEPLQTSMPNVGFLVLRYLERQPDKRATLGCIAKELRKYDVTHYRPLIFGLVFLHSVDAISFEAPYFYLTP